MKFKKSALFAFVLTIVCGAAFARPPIERIIERLDVDGDGLISQDEFQPPARDGKKHIDTNEDGAVSTSELMAHQLKMTQRMQERHEKMLEHFEAADADADGLVTPEEARLAAFNRADEDADGYLSAAELKNAKPKGPGHAFGKHRDRQDRPHKRGEDSDTI